MSDPITINKLQDSAAGRAMEAVQAASGTLDQFSDFTTSLVRDIFKTVITASIDQLEAYADLVSKVSLSLADYESKVLGADLDKRARAYADQVVLPVYGKLVSGNPPKITNVGDTGVTAGNTDLELSKLEEFKAVFDGVIIGTSPEKSIESSGVILTPTTTPAISNQDLSDFCKAKLRRDVKKSYDQLVTILKLGMQKIVVTEGEIRTSITFHVDSTDSDTKNTSDSTTDYEQRSRSFGAGLKVGGTFGKISGSLAMGYNSSRFNSKLKVNVVNESKTAVTNTSTDITGSVLIKFKSDYFPSFDPTQPV
jgi:hypothetical protein